MPGAATQVTRRMGLGRGLRACNVPQSRESPNVGLQQQNTSSPGNADRDPVQSDDSKADFDCAGSEKYLETSNAALRSSENRPAAETAFCLGADMYFLDSRHQNGIEGNRVGLLVSRTKESAFTKEVDRTVDVNEYMDHVGTPFQSNPKIWNVREIEKAMIENLKLERTSPPNSTERFPNKEARDRWIAACHRFLRPALLRAQADRVEKVAGQNTAATEKSRTTSYQVQVPPSIKGENLTNAPVSSEMGSLQEMNGTIGYHAEQYESCVAMKPCISQSMKLHDDKARKPCAVSIPTQRVSSDEVRLTNSGAIPPGRIPERNPVFIKPLPDISTIQPTRTVNRTAGNVLRTSSDPNNNSRGMIRTGLQRGRTFNGSPEQECIKKKRCHVVGDWKSFLVRNFSPADEGSFAIWITESEESLDLQEQFANIDERRLQVLSSHRLGGTALLKRGGKYLRVMIMDLLYTEAAVEDVDSGDKIGVKIAELFCLPQALKAIPPRALKVIVEADRITNVKRFETALQLAKQHQTVTDGCALTWDFVPKFVFRLPGCRALAVTKTPVSTQWHQDGVFSFRSKQKLYKDLPEVLLPAAGNVVKECLITHVEGSTVYITYEALHNFVLVPVAEDLPLVYEVGRMCLIAPEWNPASPSPQMRCCIEAVQGETVLVRWIDCGSLFEVPKPYLLPLPASLIYPPGTVKATLASFQPADLESVGDALSRVLLSLVSSQIIFLDSKSVPEILIFTDEFIEVKPDTLNRLEARVKNEEEPAAEEAPETLETQETKAVQEQPREATVVGIAAFRQVWVVPRDLMDGLQDMEARLTRSKPPLLEDCLPDTPCAVMHDNVLRRGLIRLRIGKRFLVRLVDRAMEISATRVFELPQEYHDLESPCYRIAVCRKQIKSAHFGRFISALRMHPDVILLPVSSRIDVNSVTESSSDTDSVSQGGHDTPTYFLTTPDGEDIMSAYGIRDQAQ